MDELIVNKTKYISSKRAHELTGYAKDYVGQLVRKGKLDAKRVGRAWYVSEDAILALASKQDPNETSATTEQRAVAVESLGPKYIAPATIHAGLPKTWSDIKYFEDERPTFPISDKRDVIKSSEMAISTNTRPVAATFDGVRVQVTRVHAMRTNQSPSSTGHLVHAVPAGVNQFYRLPSSRALDRRTRVVRAVGAVAGAGLFIALLAGIKIFGY